MRHVLAIAGLLLFACVTANAAISRDGSCVATATSCTLSATATGSLVVVFAYRNASVTAPTVPSGLFEFDTLATAAGGTPGVFAVGCKIASSSGDTSSGVWTNATSVAAVSYSGANTGQHCFFAIGSLLSHNSAKANTTASYLALTMTNASGSSWVTAFQSGSAGSFCTPTNLTLVGSAGATVSIKDSNAGATTWPTTTCTVTSETWMTSVFEVIAAGQQPVVDNSVWESWSDTGACGGPGSPCSSIQKGGAGNPPPVDEVIVINLVWGDATQVITASVADTCGNTWSSMDGPVNLGTDARAQSFYSVNTLCTPTSGQDLITATISSGSNGSFFDGILITIYAVQNVTTSPLDTSFTAHATGSGATMTVNSGTPSQNNEMVMGQGVCDGSCSPLAGTGYTSIIGDAVAIMEFKDITNGAAQTVTANPNGGAPWLIFANAFKAFTNVGSAVKHAPPMIY